MSINVTVHGNPISIKRGKMVAIDADREFERRRKIRLQQVRQQSKEIAEDVRNKVRKEKNKQFSKLEKNAERDLKRLQDRKLSSLQKQYQDCLEEFGYAYKEAENQPYVDDIIQKVNEIDRNQAEFRGKCAIEKQKEEKKEQEKESKKHIDDRNYARNIENMRSKLVSSLQRSKNKQSPFKTKRKKKLVADIHINGVSQIITDDSDENYDSEHVNLSVLDEMTPNSYTRSSCSNVSLDSEGNSIYSQNSTRKESNKENDIDSICNNQSDVQQLENEINIKPKESRLSKISFKESEEIVPRNKFYTNDDCQDENSYRSHTTPRKNDRIKDMSYSKCRVLSQSQQTYNDKIERIDSLGSRMYKSSFISDRLNPCCKEYKERGQQMSSNIISGSKEPNQSDLMTHKLSDQLGQQHFKEYEQDDELKHMNNKLFNYSSHFNQNLNDDQIKRYRERLQSGTDADVLKLYREKFAVCDESNCPAVLAVPVKPKSKISSPNTQTLVKSSKYKRNNNPKTNTFRKTIRSIKSTPLKRVDESEVFLNIHDYDLPEEGFRKVSPQKSPCNFNKRISPSKLKNISSSKIRGHGTVISDLPFVPTITVRPESSDAQDSTVRYYDHFNRFSKDGLHPSVVQKISKESIEVCPPSDEERQYRDIMVRRDEEAKKRGMKALEKNKIHRNYQQLMEELPVLQRQERLASMASHNPAHHMSDERYQNLERKKQNQMENLYENYEMKSKGYDIPLITLKSIRKSPPSSDMKQPFKTLDVSENSIPVLNVGQWEAVNSTTSSTSQTIPEESPSDFTEDKEQALADLLRRVNKQREILLKEAANLSSLQSLKDVLNEEELLSLLCKCPGVSRDIGSRVLVETGTSPLVIKESSTLKKTKKVKSVSVKTSSKNSSKRTATTSSSDTSVEIPHKNIKKGKSRKKLKILIREEGTQTSPLISKSIPDVFKRVEEEMREEGTQTSLCCPNAGGVSCFCSKNCHQVMKDVTDQSTKKLVNNSTSTSDSFCEKVCEIIIKARDDSNVEINSLSPSRTLKEKTSAKSISDKSKKELPKKSSIFIKIKEADNVDKRKTDIQEAEKQEVDKWEADKRDAVKREIALKNMLEMSTSTSYLSPPAETSKKSDTVKASTSWKQPSQRSSNKELLHPQRQQTNIDNLVREENGGKEVDPRLIKYITRLLNLSRQNIDELTISSVSDVSTPTDSIILTTSNVAREKLQSVMDHFNLSVDDVKKYYLSTSTLSTSDISMDNVQVQKNLQEKMYHNSDSNNYRERSDVMKTASPKQFTSVSTSTDVEDTIRKMPKDTKSTVTTSSLEQEIYELKKQEGYAYSSTSTGYKKTESKSPKGSTTLSDSTETKKPLTTSTTVEISSTLGGKQTIRCPPQSPKQISSGLAMAEEPTNVHEVCENCPKLHSSVSRYPQFIVSSSTEFQQVLPKSPKSHTKSPPSISRESCYSSTVKKTVSPKSVPPKIVTTNQPHTTSCSPKRENCKVTVPLDSHSLSDEEAVWRKPEKFLQFVRESLGMSVEEFSELGLQEMFSRHMELTEYCHDRIKSLMTLIEKVRNDKRQIYSPSPDEHSMTLTSYLELPQLKPDIVEPNIQASSEYVSSIKKNQEQEISGSSSSSSISQGTLDDYLLGVERNEIAQKKEKIKKKVTYVDEVASVINEGISNSKNVQETFVPMLQGIPKYCEVDSAEQQNSKNFMTQIFQHIKPKPPPSLLRANMRGHTDVTPHELSTIAEAETIVSSRNTSLHPAQSPVENVQREESPSRQGIEVTKAEFYADEHKSTSNMQTQTLEVKFVSPIEHEKSVTPSDSSGTPSDYVTISPERTVYSDKESREDKKASKTTSPTNLNTSSSSIRKSSMSGIRRLSDSTTESQDELESMLRKFKLEWAIALVRKTEQALALSSSSSTSDLMQSRVKQDHSDVSVREAYQQIYNKIASSSGSDIEKSQIFMDLSQHFREFHDISEIAGVAESRNKSQQRTSTPVQHSKSTDSKKSDSKDSLFKDDSELSSVRNSSGGHMFLSIPNITLNTTKCSLNKSKK